MTEMELIHLLRRYFSTPFCLFILCATPQQKMRARVTRDGTICAKTGTYGYFDGTNPITGKIIQLRSPTPIMAPGFKLFFRLNGLIVKLSAELFSSTGRDFLLTQRSNLVPQRTKNTSINVDTYPLFSPEARILP